MARCLLALCFLWYGAQASAETVIAAGTIRSQTIIGPSDLAVIDEITPGAISRLEDAIGLEARVNLYPGRPIAMGDLAQPSVINRNEVITLQFERAGLTILTEGRALERAATGDRMRVMNLASRLTVTGTVLGPGLVSVSQLP